MEEKYRENERERERDRERKIVKDESAPKRERRGTEIQR